MNYSLQAKKFFSSQYLYTGLKVTAGVLIPAYILYDYGLLISMIGIPLGALFVSMTDSPGPISSRRDGMLACIGLCFIVLVISGFSRGSHPLIIAEIIFFGLFLSMIAIYGNRANSIGLVTLMVFIINIDAYKQNQDVMEQSAYFLVGGTWYAILSLVLYTLRPYRPIQQLLGECLMEIAEYLRTKGLLYRKERDHTSIYQQLMESQVKIQNYQNDLREMLFTTRKYFSESTKKGRVLMMMFLDSIDLLESIMTSQQDYELMHKEFDDSGVVEKLNRNINSLADELHNIGLAVQSGFPYKSKQDLNAIFQDSMNAFLELRQKNISAANLEAFIMLRHILYSLQDVTERIKRLEYYTTYDKSIAKNYGNQEDFKKFIPRKEVGPRLLLDNISLKSSNFRHAVRLTIALLAGYIISMLFPLGHSYWILLTIAVIMKPAYGITRKRNIQRLVGTFSGAGIGFAILYLTNNNGVLFILMIAAMIVAYSFLRLNYGISSAAITIYVLLNFYFLSPEGLKDLLTDRIIDTVIGSAIAYLISYFILPSWENKQMDELMSNAIRDNQDYFNKSVDLFTEGQSSLSNYKMARKNAFVSLANLSDDFQQMLSEPKGHQQQLEEIHQFVAASHMLTSQIASLAYYARRSGKELVKEEFQPVVRQINKKFEIALKLLKSEGKIDLQSDNLPMNKRVQQLLELRKKDLEEGVETDQQNIRKKLSDLKSITDQFQLIYSNLNDQTKIISKLKNIIPPSSQTVLQN